MTETFTVNNTGEDPLTLGAISVPAGFSFTMFGSTTLNAGASTTFTVTCDADSLGLLSGTVSFSNNDGDENPYNFAVTCTVTPPPTAEIDVQGLGNSIVSGDNTPSVTDDTDFGSTVAGTTVTHTFTILNIGTANLTVSAATVPAGFTVTASPTSPVAGSGNTSFDCPVRCARGGDLQRHGLDPQ